MLAARERRKRKEENMAFKDIRRKHIVTEATRLFFERSIYDVKIREVAAKSGVGEATFYRYFTNRASLIVACATLLQETVGAEYFHFEEGGTGFDKLSAFYAAFLKAFKEHIEYYRFLSEFDAYCIAEEVKGLDQYSEKLDVFKSFFIAAYEQGLKDGTVKAVKDVDLFYYSTTHALLSLCKKLASQGNIVKQDELVNKKAEVTLLRDLILSALKK